MGRILPSGRIFRELQLGEPKRGGRSKRADALERDMGWLLKTSKDIVEHPITQEITKLVDKGVSSAHRENKRKDFKFTYTGQDGQKKGTDLRPTEKLGGSTGRDLEPAETKVKVKTKAAGKGGISANTKTVEMRVSDFLDYLENEDPQKPSGLDITLADEENLSEYSDSEDGSALVTSILDQPAGKWEDLHYEHNKRGAEIKGSIDERSKRETELRLAAVAARDAEIKRQLDSAGQLNTQMRPDGQPMGPLDVANPNGAAMMRFNRKVMRPAKDTAIQQTFEMNSVGDVFRLARRFGHIPEFRAQAEVAIASGWLNGQERSLGQDVRSLILSQQGALHRLFAQMDQTAAQRAGADQRRFEFNVNQEWRNKQAGDRMKLAREQMASQERRLKMNLDARRDRLKGRRRRGSSGGGGSSGAGQVQEEIYSPTVLSSRLNQMRAERKDTMRKIRENNDVWAAHKGVIAETQRKLVSIQEQLRNPTVKVPSQVAQLRKEIAEDTAKLAALKADRNKHKNKSKIKELNLKIASKKGNIDTLQDEARGHAQKVLMDKQRELRLKLDSLQRKVVSASTPELRNTWELQGKEVREFGDALTKYAGMWQSAPMKRKRRDIIRYLKNNPKIKEVLRRNISRQTE